MYWQGVRVHVEHNVHARELDLLLKDDLVRREVTMVHVFEGSQHPFSDLHLRSPPSMKSKDILTGVMFESTSAL